MSDHFDEEPDGDPHGECALEINRLKAECERLRADAERYRWLRDNNYDRTVCQIHTIKHWYEPHSKTGEPTEWRVRLRGPRNLDAAIDAARAKP